MNNVPFGSVAEFRNGTNYSAGEIGVHVKMVGVGDFGALSRLADFSTIKEIRMSSALSEQDWLKDGDLLFVRSNGNKKLIGRCMLMEAPPDSVAHSGFTIRARVDTIRDGKQISYTDFRSIRLPLPRVPEQIALSGLLDLADQDIALCRARLDRMQLQKRALMQKLLSGEWRFPTAPPRPKIQAK